jgi:chemotaxis protein methyltransferase CheR
MRQGEALSVAPLSAEDLDLVRTELDRRCGLRTELVSDLQLTQAVEKAAASAERQDPTDFVRALCLEHQTDGPLLQQLIRRVTIGETSFFRHPEDLSWLSNDLFAKLLDAREAQGDRCLRLWSAGCASGEEAYSLAALALAEIEKRDSPDAWQLSVLATDINSDALSTAKRALYGEWSFRGVGSSERSRWFQAEGDRYAPIDAIRRPVSLAYLNLRDPIYPAIMTGTSALDLIVCRNVFIYFFPAMIAEALARFDQCLAPDGALLCGPSDLFEAQIPAGFRRMPGAPHRLTRARENESRAVEHPQTPAAPRWVRAAPPPALTREPPTPTPREEGLVLLQKGRYPEAAAWARSAIIKAELSAPLRHCLALALSAQNSPDALSAWKDFLYLSPEDPEAHLGLAFAFVRSQRLGDAQRHFRAVLQYLGPRRDEDRLPGPDGLKVGWVRAACRSLARGTYRGRTV